MWKSSLIRTLQSTALTYATFGCTPPSVKKMNAGFGLVLRVFLDMEDLFLVTQGMFKLTDFHGKSTTGKFQKENVCATIAREEIGQIA